MKKNIYLLLVKIISNLIITLNKINILFFSKYDFLSRIADEIEEHKYFIKEINKKKINFYIPTEISHSRVNSIFAKEPETIDWINNFKDGRIFWDIGANIGVYSIYAASKFKNLKMKIRFWIIIVPNRTQTNQSTCSQNYF